MDTQKQVQPHGLNSDETRKVGIYARVYFYLALAVFVVCIFIIASLFLPASDNEETSRQKIISQTVSIAPSPPTTSHIMRSDNLEVIIPDGALDREFTFKYVASPFAHTETLSSIKPSLRFRAYDTDYQYIKQLLKPFQFTYKYKASQVFNVKEETLKFYRRNDEKDEWEAIPTSLDTLNKTATAETIYIDTYAFMGEIIDKIPPTTKIVIEGVKTEENRYKSPVIVKLIVQDNEESLGIDYILYKLSGEDWKEYTTPIVLENRGKYKIEYYSGDKGGNYEDVKTQEFYVG